MSEAVAHHLHLLDRKQTRDSSAASPDFNMDIVVAIVVR